MQYEFDALTPDHRAEIADYRRANEKIMRDALEDGVAQGALSVRDVKGTALALLSMSIDLVRWYHPAGQITPDDIAKLHGELAVRMVAAS